VDTLCTTDPEENAYHRRDKLMVGLNTPTVWRDKLAVGLNTLTARRDKLAV